MSRRSTSISPANRDGTSQRSRELAALAPSYAPIDERSTSDLLALVKSYADQIVYFTGGDDPGDATPAGTWGAFLARDDVSIADMVAYIADPAGYGGDRARWLARPHFALLLTFVELLRHARESINDFTRRHLDHFYRELLLLRPEPPAADRVNVVFGLSPATTEHLLPKGTELTAGRDANGAPMIYVTERDLVVNRADIAGARSIFIDRRITGISDVRSDRSLTASSAFDKTLTIALGSPSPGDPVPPWNGKPVDTALFVSLYDLLAFATAKLYLEQYELREMMQLVRQRGPAADSEWAKINKLLGVTNPAKPRDFMANLTSVVGVLDFTADGLPQVDSVDDLYTYRTDPDVRAYIDTKLQKIGFDNFVALMQIKLRIDAEWKQINLLLERAGRRLRGLLQWSLPPGDPTAFDANLAAALAGAWPPPWPFGTKTIYDYDTMLRDLEQHLCLPVERIAVLVAFAQTLGKDASAEAHDWSDVDVLLADAYREKLRAARQAEIAGVREGGQDVAAFDATANFVLGNKTPDSWDIAKQKLASHLDASQLDLLSRFRDGIASNDPIYGFGWSDADRLFELASRDIQQVEDPIAQEIEIHNVYAYDDATQFKSTASANGWETFGSTPPFDENKPAGAVLGFALRSPLLSMSEGTRTLTLTIGLGLPGFTQADQQDFLKAIGVGTTTTLTVALQQALVFEVSTDKRWLELQLVSARLASGKPGDDYWKLLNQPRVGDTDRPGLQLVLSIGADKDAIAPLKGDPHEWPMLRVTLRRIVDKAAREWKTLIEAFQPLVVVAANLGVAVDGLKTLHLQQDDRSIDPRKPFEPFGSRPLPGARFYIEHPELVRPQLSSLTFTPEWMGLPSRTLADYYFNYRANPATSDFRIDIAFIDLNLKLDLGQQTLFKDATGYSVGNRLAIPDVNQALQTNTPGAAYVSRYDLPPADDIRAASRYLVWELGSIDFGHSAYPGVAAKQARDFALALAGTSKPANTDAYRVETPYTPTVKSLSVAYTAQVDIDPTAMTEHELLNVHPFGTCPLDPAQPTFVPRYDLGGELYIGIRDLAPPQNVALLLQLAEGTSDPDIEPVPITWSYLDGNTFVDLTPTAVVADTTRGLINSGIVELVLPAAGTGDRLPSDLYWLRVAIARNPQSVCDVVAIRAQAVTAVFDDRNNAQSHYEQPLPVGAITRLRDADVNIALVDQPYSSFGGRPAEQSELFDTRVSERLRHKNRAVSAWDYERLVLHGFPQIFKAKCLSSSDGVDVIVIPDIRELHPADPFAPKAPANLLADIQSYLVARAPAAATIHVRNAQYVAVKVRLGVRFVTGTDAGFAQTRLEADLIRFLSPWAFDDGVELMIGGKIYANSILDFVDRRDYVDFVAEIELFRSFDGSHFDLVPPTVGDYHVQTERPDQVLVAAQQHDFDIIGDTGYRQSSFIGIGYSRIELDFIVG